MPSRILYSIAGVLAIIAVVVFGCLYIPWDRRPSPDELERTALEGATSAEKERAAVELAGRGAEAGEHLRRVLQKSKLPQVRAAAIQGLGAQHDYESVEALLDALEDESPLVRGRAGIAMKTLLGVDFRFRAAASPEERAVKVQLIRKAWDEMRESGRLDDFKQRKGLK